MDLKGLYKKIKLDSIFIAIFTIALGILCAVMPMQAGEALCIIFGAVLITIGLIFLFKFFTVDRLLGNHLLVMAILTIMLGIVCLVYTEFVQQILGVALGVFIVVDSALLITDSSAKDAGWLTILILSIITACLGVYIIVAPSYAPMLFIGCSLILDGIKRLVITIIISCKIKKAKKQITKDVIDV